MARTPKRVAADLGDHAPRRLIIECKPAQVAAMAMAPAAAVPRDLAAIVKEAGATLDTGFAPVLLPAVAGQDPMEPGFDTSTRFDVSAAPGDATMLLVADGDAAAAEALAKRPEVVQVFADLPIEPCLICPGSPPLGNAADVANLLCTRVMQERGLNGLGVLLAIVDTGINKNHLASLGITPAMDVGRSWTPAAGMTPFDAPVGHGTMCAFDALIGAPRATLLDIQLLRSGAGAFTAFLSDAVRAFDHLRRIMEAPRRPGETRSLVVNNSWGMFHPSWDFPPGDPRNYSDNPNHPFNRAVAALEAAGADILFAAGNCGSDCPDGRCQGVTNRTIYGANGHPSVLTVAGVDTTKKRVGYSSKGPGRLSVNKPDIAGYTHFAGSGVYAADGGTSAACPVVAGVVAAARTKKPFLPGNPSASPHAMRELIRSTAEDLGAAGFDHDTGYGVVNGCAVADRVVPQIIVPPIDICRRFPDLCRRPVPIDFCRRYPQLCNPVPGPVPGPIPGPIPGPVPAPIPGPIPGPRPLPGLGDAEAGEASLEQILAAMWQMGYEDARRDAAAAPAPQRRAGGCACGGGD
ncbi:subtilisin family serine protease [Roseomonas alkaliterrae]|uniref:Subtilisin family serine protease n=1 Tax=Neoroseomonas alkaliterrae TaxID=1452450 RepID=A0A840XV49_9PROT|nr:S8 family serine peptidase [Neoroseomonas alkaliterrae]MBB5690960.1 subtilisin family serine protease [Neoroseomonas alkaliterrae]